MSERLEIEKDFKINMRILEENILAKFQLNNKQYYILLENNSIRFVYSENGSIDENMTDDEYNMCAEVYNSLVINKSTIIYCGKYKINRNYFNVFYDRNIDFYFFGKWINNRNVRPTKKELELLNIYYNNQTLTCYSKKKKQKVIDDMETDKVAIDKETSKKKNFFKRYFIPITYSSVIAILVASSIFLPSLPGEVLFKGKLYEDNIRSRINSENSAIHHYIDNNHKLNEILDSLESNKNISDEEKDFIKKLIEPIIIENIEYIYVKETAKKFKNLKIVYHPYYVRNNDGDIAVNSDGIQVEHIGGNTEITIDGEWNELSESINLYQDILPLGTFSEEEKMNLSDEDIAYNFGNCDKSILAHEIMHMFTKLYSNTYITKTMYEIGNSYTLVINKNKYQDVVNKMRKVFGKVLREVVNNLFSTEYLAAIAERKTVTGYEFQMPVVYALAEIIPTQAIRAFQFDADMNHIVDELLKIDSDEEKIYDLITSINTIMLYHKNLGQAETEQSKETAQEELDTNYRRIHDLFAMYYEKKNNKKMIDDPYMLACFYNTRYETEEEHEKFKRITESQQLPYSEYVKRVIPRGYISKEYIKKYPSPKLYLGENIEIALEKKNNEYDEVERG